MSTPTVRSLAPRHDAAEHPGNDSTKRDSGGVRATPTRDGRVTGGTAS